MAKDGKAVGVDLDEYIEAQRQKKTVESVAEARERKAGGNPLVFGYIDQSKAVPTLSWKDLTFSVGGKGPERRQILKGITGQLRPGELTCILGPSGSGKTSLLNILAGRVKPGGRNSAQIGGEMRVEGTRIEAHKVQHLFGYVMQEDALFATSTPREIFQFSASLRLGIRDPASMNQVLQDMIKALGLVNCADSMVGSELIKGISGGEKKRVAIGQELITNPQITFLDEPTSGLDSEAAYSVVRVLRELTRANQSVLCTIHQPSSETFFLFDKAIFLARGHVIYAGGLQAIRDHFAQLRCPCPRGYNPADFVLFLTKHADDETMARLVDGVPVDLPATDLPVVELPKPRPTKGFFAELRQLVMREARSTVRDKATLAARFGTVTFLTVLQSLIFFRIGSEDLTESGFSVRDAYDFQSHVGATMMLGIFAMFGAAQPVILTFSGERPVFLRERACNTYSTAPYFMSKTLAEIPIVALQMLVQWVIAYPLMALRGDFLVHWAGSFLVGLVSASTALCVGCFVADAKTATELTPVCFVPQILLGGFFIKMESVPVWLRWVQYIVGLKWGMNVITVNEFEGTAQGDDYLRMNDANADDIGLYVAVLLGLFVGFRLIAMFGLARKAKALYN